MAKSKVAKPKVARAGIEPATSRFSVVENTVPSVNLSLSSNSYTLTLCVYLPSISLAGIFVSVYCRYEEIAIHLSITTYSYFRNFQWNSSNNGTGHSKSHCSRSPIHLARSGLRSADIGRIDKLIPRGEL